MPRTEVSIGNNVLSIETGKMAKQADGAVLVQYGETIVLVTAVSPHSKREGLDFFPLTVDYREKTAAAGKFPGGYLKREGRPTEKEILTCRLTDRPIRPLFPEGYFNEVQIMCSVISADDENDPDLLAINGASAALSISDIPFAGPIGAVRIGMIGEEFIVNPTYEQCKESTLDLVVAGSKDAILMVEGKALELSEDKMIEAVFTGHEEIKKIVEIQNKLAAECGKEKREVTLDLISDELLESMSAQVSDSMEEALLKPQKRERANALDELRDKAKEALLEKDPEISELFIKRAFEEIEKKKIRELILDRNMRIDGRKMDEIRQITSEVGLIPRTHGSALFTRGETQALVTATLGTKADAQKMEGYVGEFSKQFMLHYTFPPFSVGEARPVRGPGRREIGHGILAERGLSAVLPQENFPYTIKIVSDILESNGSSSMASVCGGCLSLMDAGVAITTPVSGIAMGLIKEGKSVAILSDILGDEDHYGDMDFKVVGTKNGITAIQMDIKIDGIDRSIMQKALDQALQGRLHILEKMLSVLPAPREEISSRAPRIESITIDKEKIGALIGPGGKNIKKIVEETGADINIDDDGTVTIASVDGESMKAALNRIQLIVEDPEPGKIYKGTVKNIMDFGAFVEILPGKEGLVHISQLAEERVNKVSDVVSEGDEIYVKLVEIDDRGRLNLSKKLAAREMEKKDEANSDQS